MPFPLTIHITEGWTPPRQEPLTLIGTATETITETITETEIVTETFTEIVTETEIVKETVTEIVTETAKGVQTPSAAPNLPP